MPIHRRNATILESTGSNMNMTGMNVKADSYYGYVDGHHTIQLVYNNYIGRLKIQASLSLNPAETDWFDLQETTVYGSVTDQTTGYNPAGYIQFNANDPANGSQAYSVTGNFAYIRVNMDRAHVGDGTTYDPSYGQITQAILSA